MTATQIRPSGRLSPLAAGRPHRRRPHAGWADTAQLVADRLHRRPPSPMC